MAQAEKILESFSYKMAALQRAGFFAPSSLENAAVDFLAALRETAESSAHQLLFISRAVALASHYSALAPLLKEGREALSETDPQSPELAEAVRALASGRGKTPRNARTEPLVAGFRKACEMRLSSVLSEKPAYYAARALLPQSEPQPTVPARVRPSQNQALSLALASA